MDKTLLTSQYKTRPEEKFMKTKVKTIGINIISFAWEGSPMGGDIFCWRNMVAPMISVRTGIP